MKKKNQPISSTCHTKRIYYQDSQVVYRDHRVPWTSNEYEATIDRRNKIFHKNQNGALGSYACVVCNNECHEVKFLDHPFYGQEIDKWLYHCDNCGWWSIRNSEYQYWSSYPTFNGHEIIWPILKIFDVSSIEVPIKMLREHLVRKYSDVRLISASKAEDLVLSVFEDAYPKAKVNYFRGSVYNADDGIDLVIVDTTRGQYGVQIKRRITKRSEPVEAIDRFVTSLFKNGLHKGVYVSVANRFSRIAREVPNNQFLLKMGLQLELMDADRFFELLKCYTPVKAEPLWLTLIGNYEECSDINYINSLRTQHGRK